MTAVADVDSVVGSFGLSASVRERRGDAVVVRLTVPPDWEYLRGHFPSFPVVPGMVIVDLAQRVAVTELSVGGDLVEVTSVRFTAPVLPGQPLDLECARTATDAVTATGRVDGVGIGRIDLSFGGGPSS